METGASAAQKGAPSPTQGETKPSIQEGESDIKDIIDKAQVSLVLDTYDDIFSDFDPRPYDQRALSGDFLDAARHAARDKREGIELRLLIPKAVRSTGSEELIKQRLKEHFRRHYRLVRKERIRYRRQAIALILAGVVIGMADALLLSTLNLDAILEDAIGIVLTPASWFTIWTGFEHLVTPPEEMGVEEEFNKKFEGAHIIFTPY